MAKGFYGITVKQKTGYSSFKIYVESEKIGDELRTAAIAYTAREFKQDPTNLYVKSTTNYITAKI